MDLLRLAHRGPRHGRRAVRASRWVDRGGRGRRRGSRCRCWSCSRSSSSSASCSSGPRPVDCSTSRGIKAQLPAHHGGLPGGRRHRRPHRGPAGGAHGADRGPAARHGPRPGCLHGAGMGDGSAVPGPAARGGDRAGTERDARRRRVGRPILATACSAIPFVALILGYQVLSAVGSQLADFLVLDRATASFPDPAELAGFLAGYTAVMNIVSIGFLLLAGPLLRRYGLRLGITANPLVLTALGHVVVLARRALARWRCWRWCRQRASRTSRSPMARRAPPSTRCTRRCPSTSARGADDRRGDRRSRRDRHLRGHHHPARRAPVRADRDDHRRWSRVARVDRGRAAALPRVRPALVDALRHRPRARRGGGGGDDRARRGVARRLLASGDPRTAQPRRWSCWPTSRRPGMRRRARAPRRRPRPDVRLAALARWPVGRRGRDGVGWR